MSWESYRTVRRRSSAWVRALRNAMSLFDYSPRKIWRHRKEFWLHVSLWMYLTQSRDPSKAKPRSQRPAA